MADKIRVLMLADSEFRQSPLSIKKCPKGSTPLVPEDVAIDWLEAGKCELAVDDAEFSPVERAILRHVAHQVAGASQPARIDFEKLNVPQLKEIAAELEVEGSAHMKRAALLEALEARHDDVAALMAAADEGDDD